MIRLKRPPRVTKNEVSERYRMIAQGLGVIGTCKSCGLPYARQYICFCGWDNTYVPCECGEAVDNGAVEVHICASRLKKAAALR